jgi:hypothetical protein
VARRRATTAVCSAAATHNYKTGQAWDCRRDSDGNLVWTSPHGFRWTQPAADYTDDYDSNGQDASCDDFNSDRLQALLQRLWAKAG